jgi:hypothetical protein
MESAFIFHKYEEATAEKRFDERLRSSRQIEQLTETDKTKDHQEHFYLKLFSEIKI